MTGNLSWLVPGVALMLAGSVAAQQPPEVRRVVTKIDSSGKAVAMFDGQVQLTSFRSPNPASEMWVTESSPPDLDRKSTRLNSSHLVISYAVFCLKKKKNIHGCDCREKKKNKQGCY